ncbi:hypothetical protein LguiA_023405 [Lonicera macranthoides]
MKKLIAQLAKRQTAVHESELIIEMISCDISGTVDRPSWISRYRSPPEPHLFSIITESKIFSEFVSQIEALVKFAEDPQRDFGWFNGGKAQLKLQSSFYQEREENITFPAERIFAEHPKSLQESLHKTHPLRSLSPKFRAMEIQQKLLKFKFHILISLTFSLIILSLLYLAPRFLEILAYFWPLLLSTALFLATVVVFGRTSPPAAEVSGEKAGEDILDFVAGQVQPEEVLQPEDSGKSEEFNISNSWVLTKAYFQVIYAIIRFGLVLIDFPAENKDRRSAAQLARRFADLLSATKTKEDSEGGASSKALHHLITVALSDSIMASRYLDLSHASLTTKASAKRTEEPLGIECPNLSIILPEESHATNATAANTEASQFTFTPPFGGGDHD